MAEWTEEDLYLVGALAHEIALQGRYPEALALFEGLAAVAPQQAYPRRSLAALRLRLGQPEQALAALRDLPAEGATPRLRLECCVQLQRWREAAREFDAMRPRLDPADRQRYALLLESKQLTAARPDN
jgi:tetratricopeptide (TPR) repeat protein